MGQLYKYVHTYIAWFRFLGALIFLQNTLKIEWYHFIFLAEYVVSWTGKNWQVGRLELKSRNCFLKNLLFMVQKWKVFNDPFWIIICIRSYTRSRPFFCVQEHEKLHYSRESRDSLLSRLVWVEGEQLC